MGLLPRMRSYREISGGGGGGAGCSITLGGVILIFVGMVFGKATDYALPKMFEDISWTATKLWSAAVVIVFFIVAVWLFRE